MPPEAYNCKSLFTNSQIQGDPKILAEFISEYEKAGFISECSDIRAALPIQVIPKKDRTARIVYDCRRLNKFFSPPQVLLPSAFLPLQKNLPFVAKIDITNCFLHFRLEE